MSGCYPISISGNDACIIMGTDHDQLIRLWRQKRREVLPLDRCDDLVAQLDTATEDLNRTRYERSTGHTVTDVGRKVRHSIHKWMGAKLDGRVQQTGALYEAAFMLPCVLSEEGAAERYMAKLQHNMWVIAARSAVLSIITGTGKWFKLTIHADPLYQHLLLTAEKKFMRCVQTGEPPSLFGIETPKAKLAST